MKKEVLYQLSCLALLLCITPAVSAYIGAELPGRLFKLILLPSVFFLYTVFKQKYVWSEKFYILMMMIAFIGHLFVDLEDKEKNPLWESFTWIVIVFLLSLSKQFNKCDLVFRAIALFFFLECTIAIYEKITMTLFVEWPKEATFFGSAESYLSRSDFRSTAFLQHALNNANVTSIFLAFILCNKYVNKQTKIALISLGFLALWAFNSRGAMIMWGLIIVYRFFFMNKKTFPIVVSAIILYILFPFVINFISDSGYFGRLSDGVDDSSTQTRFDSYLFFALHPWNSKNILLGGDIIYMPGSVLSLENGILLNLGYWGWIIGSFKTILEVWISYKVLPSDLETKSKLIIMAATWGVAFMNNNSFQPMIFSYYLVILVAFNTYNTAKSYPNHT